MLVKNFLNDQGLHQRDRVSHRALLGGRRHDCHSAQFPQFLQECPQPGCKNAIIVRQQDIHVASIWPGRAKGRPPRLQFKFLQFDDELTNFADFLN